ncbi:MAG: hypothetical protein ABSA07_05890 [Acidimicrobiales bacterium]
MTTTSHPRHQSALSHRRRELALRVVPVLAVLATGFVLASPASAGGYSMKVSGPAINKMGADFNYVISGSAGGPADRVVAWEQYYKSNGCAPTFAGESVRAVFEPSGLYGLTKWTNEAVSGSYSVTAAFGAANPGVHGICAYLINYTTGQTYAEAGAFWKNVAA